MFEVFIIIFIIYIIAKKNSDNLPIGLGTMLDKALKNQQFSNIQTIQTNSSYSLISADTHGENYLFALKKSDFFNANDLKNIYDKSKNEHFHNTVVVCTQNFLQSSLMFKKIKEYNFEVWDLSKLISLSKTSTKETTTKSVLRTSDTSLDNCDIDIPVDPIKHGPSNSHSILTNPFRKPNRL